MRPAVLSGILLLAVQAHGQFVWPKESYHERPDGLYKEDPFITHYREEFFAVFQGDYKRFDKAYAEIQAMVKKDPKDARAVVWLGNGTMVKAGSAMLKDKTRARAMLQESSKLLDQAVALKPQDPNIYMMRAATLYLYGQYFPKDWVDRSVWTRLRDDCTKFLGYLGPRITKVSIHLRGETYGELGIAYLNLGDKEHARWAFEQILKQDRKTDYGARAMKEIEKLSSPPKKSGN